MADRNAKTSNSGRVGAQAPANPIPTSSGRFSRLSMAAVYDERVTPTGLRVLAALASYADKNSFCYPAQGTIARRLKMGRRTIQRQIASLDRLGYLLIEPRVRNDGRGGYAPNGYMLQFPAVAADPGPAANDATATAGPEMLETEMRVRDVPGPILGDAPCGDASGAIVQGAATNLQPEPLAMRYPGTGDAPRDGGSDAPRNGAQTIPSNYPKSELAQKRTLIQKSQRHTKNKISPGAKPMAQILLGVLGGKTLPAEIRAEEIDWASWAQWLERCARCNGWTIIREAWSMGEISGLEPGAAKLRVDAILKQARKTESNPFEALKNGLANRLPKLGEIS